jgi:hypothetical protein
MKAFMLKLKFSEYFSKKLIKVKKVKRHGYIAI